MKSIVSIYTVDNKRLQATGFDAELMSHDFGLQKWWYYEFICECPLIFKEDLIKCLISKGRTVFIDGLKQQIL